MKIINVTLAKLAVKLRELAPEKCSELYYTPPTLEDIRILHAFELLS